VSQRGTSRYLHHWRNTHTQKKKREKEKIPSSSLGFCENHENLLAKTLVQKLEQNFPAVTEQF